MFKKSLFAIFVSLISVALCAEEKAAAAPAPYQPPQLSAPGSWSMIMIPDTQTYTKKIENHGILDMMFAWAVRRSKEMNIQQLVVTGDLVYYNDTWRVVEKPDPQFGGPTDLISEEQWRAISRLFTRLDGQLPYVVCTGNHDYGTRSAESRKSSFTKYFPTDRNPLTRKQLIGCAKNSDGNTSLETSAYEFTAPHPDGRKFLIITLKFAPTDKDLQWAKQIADEPRFADHFGIVLTHSYLSGDGTRIEKENYPLNKKGGNAGEAIFQKLVFPAKNIRMVLCGHVAAPDNWEKSVGFSMTKNSAGKSVAQMAFNTQAIGGGFHGNGGDGWLRILEFMPDRKTIKATTFSPLFAISPSTQHLAWKRDARNEFTFVLE